MLPVLPPPSLPLPSLPAKKAKGKRRAASLPLPPGVCKSVFVRVPGHVGHNVTSLSPLPPVPWPGRGAKAKRRGRLELSGRKAVCVLPGER